MIFCKKMETFYNPNICQNWLNVIFLISSKQYIFGQKFISVTSHKTDKIRGPSEVIFCSKMYCVWDIVKKLFFQNFVTLKCCGGHVYGAKYLKIGMSCFFVPTYQTNLKNLQIYNSFGYFSIGPISGPIYAMAHPVWDQIWRKLIVKLILTCPMILRKGHGILRKNWDFFY